ncbi:protein kinase [Ornithinimicrobium ciconiae]|uniref:Protein kinase n=1 Tax=Ornithinimicrobium ciconiae TaxID=2594265 RepID=A0A516GA14_9MICO|nr:serine/threonine-protein kinase [Ornithinimicrobium ciconiae]QDO88367.1 protein kinase [Ornithinimicrobium ciconiae]
MDVPQIPGYDVLGRIGVGSSAQVWRARRRADDLAVALKVLPTEPEQVTAALREAGVLARVRHEHVIHLYDVLPVPGEGGRPGGIALAMELADGGSLAEVLGAREHLTPGELVTVCSPLAGALAELHRAGVVHGDVAPGNVLFRADGMPLLADLGVSRIAGEVRTQTYGTDGMVAPEVLEGFAPSAESDVYGLGALAWRCLVGEPPGWVGTRSALADLRPELPAPLVALVTACLAAEPSERPEAEEVAVALFAAARPEPVELAPGADPAAGLTQRIRVEDSLSGPDPERDADGEAGRARETTGAVGRGRTRDRGAILARAGAREVHPRALHRAATEPTGRGLRARVSAVSAASARTRAGWMLGGVVVLLVGALLLVPAVRSLLPGAGPDEGGTPQAPGTLEVAGASVLADAAAPVPDTDDATSATAAPGTAEAAPGTTEAAPVPGTAGPGAPEATTEASAQTVGQGLTDPVDDPRGVAQQLLDARATAWSSGDPADLERAHLSGSPAYEQEVDSLDSAREQEVAYRGLEFTVTRASVLESEADRVRMELDVERSDYQVVTPQGTMTHPGSTAVVELELHRFEHGWRIWGWG